VQPFDPVDPFGGRNSQTSPLEHEMKRTQHFLAALTLSATCVATPLLAHADEADDWGALTAQWWQWALSIPAASNPVADTSGEYCMVGQRGGVWFLAGTFTGTPTERTCTVPANVPLFFPVINYIYFNTPDCDQGGISYTAKELRAIIAPTIDGASDIAATLDDRPIKGVRRVKSEVFATVLPAFSLFDPSGTICLTPGEIYSPSVDDGYYVRLRALSEGQHRLAFRGTNADGFAINVRYTLNAVKVIGK
jgi:hypothetical protein